MNSLIAKSYPVKLEHEFGEITWLEAVDQRAMGMDDCDCKKPTDRWVDQLDMGNIVRIMFAHPDKTCCMMVFLNAHPEYKSLSFDQCKSLIGMESVEDEEK